jgi:hypothetical protein
MRLINRLLAALLALALFVLGVLVVVEVIAQRLGNEPAIVDWPQIYNWASQTAWTQGSVRVTCIILAVVGLILLLAELKPRRLKRLPVDSAASDAAYTRRGVATAIGYAVGDVDGISHTSVTVRRRKVKVQARTAGLEPYTAESLREPATAAARDRLNDLQLASNPKLSVRVTTRSR